MTVEQRIAFYTRAMREAAAALRAPDPDLDRERRLIREAQEAGA